ncbi:hypothetical protein Taro_018212 [Colocasia esculenta]|uniref:Uncharacterized protein n=1 Tax=Colocasia esculenta TaxID=4460 RepID=A0A843V1S6_COLES|nr:hypothetical protein [Colocasia esculenta]
MHPLGTSHSECDGSHDEFWILICLSVVGRPNRAWSSVQLRGAVLVVALAILAQELQFGAISTQGGYLCCGGAAVAPYVPDCEIERSVRITEDLIRLILEGFEIEISDLLTEREDEIVKVACSDDRRHSWRALHRSIGMPKLEALLEHRTFEGKLQLDCHRGQDNRELGVIEEEEEESVKDDVDEDDEFEELERDELSCFRGLVLDISYRRAFDAGENQAWAMASWPRRVLLMAHCRTEPGRAEIRLESGWIDQQGTLTWCWLKWDRPDNGPSRLVGPWKAESSPIPLILADSDGESAGSDRDWP